MITNNYFNQISIVDILISELKFPETYNTTFSSNFGVNKKLKFIINPKS
jgi:hypothetical protein